MSLEEQKSKLAAARAKAQGTLAKGDSADAACGVSQVAAGVRGAPLGCDREGVRYWKLQAAAAFGGRACTVLLYCVGSTSCNSCLTSHGPKLLTL